MSIFKNIPQQLNGRFSAYLFFLCLILVSCSGNRIRNIEIKSVAEGQSVMRAERFSLSEYDSFTKVTIINPWQGAENINHVYYLIDRGSPLPVNVDSSEVILVPLKSIICMSTTHVAMITALGEENTITGVSGTDYIYSDVMNKNIDRGWVADVGYESGLNNELIIKISPDLIMMYGIGSESTGYIARIKELGLKIIFNADYLETDPLGKAEWIKLFGALYCKKELADSIYNSEVEAYNGLKNYISQSSTNLPKILLGLPFKDTWYISPGNSFISKLISDAAGEYLWQHTESSVSMPHGIENVYLSALEADYWLNIGSVHSKDDVSMVDQRLLELPCFKNGNMYNNNKRINLNGGNDYWETGTVYPHFILKDIASILHPGLFKDHELFFYKKID